MLGTTGADHSLRITAQSDKLRERELARGGEVIVTTNCIANSQGNTWAIGRFVSQHTRSAVNKTLITTTLGVRHLTGGAGNDVLLIDANDTLINGAILGVSQNTAATLRHNHNHNGDTAQLRAKTKLWSNHRDGNSVATRLSMNAQTPANNGRAQVHPPTQAQESSVAIAIGLRTLGYTVNNEKLQCGSFFLWLCGKLDFNMNERTANHFFCLRKSVV